MANCRNGLWKKVKRVGSGFIALALLSSCGSQPITFTSGVPLDTDKHAYPGSRSGGSFNTVMQDFGIPIKSETQGLRYYVQTTQDTRELFLKFSTTQSVASQILHELNVPSNYAMPGCGNICAVDTVNDVVPWGLRMSQVDLTSYSLSNGSTESGGTLDLVVDSQLPADPTLYLKVIIGS